MTSYWAETLVSTALCLAVLGATAGAARADDLQDAFSLRNAGDLVTICTVPASNERYAAALAFCQGFAVGTYRTAIEADAGIAARRGASGRTMFCPTGDGSPSRTEAVTEFVAWTQSHPDVLTQSATDGVVRFMAERFACPPAASVRARSSVRR